MNHSNNLRLNNLLFLASLSTSVLNLAYVDNSLIPNDSHNFTFMQDVSDWNKNIIDNPIPNLCLNTHTDDFKIIIEFSNNLLKNSQNIEDEFVKIVNDNFWDLL